MNATETIVSLEEPLLDAEQAAALLNVKPSWVRAAPATPAAPAASGRAMQVGA